MNHLAAIEARQRKSLLHDALFVALLAFATIVSVSTFTKAIEPSAVVAHR